MTRRSFIVSRREALRLGVVAAWSLASLGLAPPTSSAVAVPVAATSDPETGLDPPRFRFDCVTPVRGFSPLQRLEEVWADPRYLTVTDCVVQYIGPPPFVLTPDESAVVAVAEAAGAVVTDRRATYLLILAASTRIDPARFDAKLAELGRPVVEASLALAPEAPQAGAFAAWLRSTG